MLVDTKGERLDISARKGADLAIPLATGINLTGATLRASIVTSLGALVAVLTCTVTNAAKGELTLSVARASLAGAPAPASLLRESTALEWGLDYTIDSVRRPVYYGVFALSAEVGIQA